MQFYSKKFFDVKISRNVAIGGFKNTKKRMHSTHPLFGTKFICGWAAIQSGYPPMIV